MRKMAKRFLLVLNPAFIPYFNVHNQIVGLQVRFDNGDKRYRWFSSVGYKNGCSARRNIANYGIPEAMPTCNKDKVIYVTEGALKAHIACSLSGNRNPYITLAGVNCFNQWEETCEYLKSLGVTHVIDAFDSDRRKQCPCSQCAKKALCDCRTIRYYDDALQLGHDI